MTHDLKKSAENMRATAECMEIIAKLDDDGQEKVLFALIMAVSLRKGGQTGKTVEDLIARTLAKEKKG